MSITPPLNIPVAIDYTGRDYYSLREEMILRAKDRLPEWTASDPADFGVALIEAFAYMGDLMSYYIDRNMNEAFISTATQRDSVLNLAQTYGYTPAGYRAAYVFLTFVNSSANSITISKGTIVSGDIVIGDVLYTVEFTTTADAICDPNVDGGEATVLAKSGRSITLSANSSYGELIGTSTGKAGQIWSLSETPVVDDTVEIYVGDGVTYSKWTKVNHLIDYGSYDQVFASTTDQNNVVSVLFGDGISGQIPAQGYEIRATYLTGGGSITNVPARILQTISYVPNLSHNDLVALQSNVTVYNGNNAIGGSDPESLDFIRYGAPISLRANNRAVTLEDFISLATQVPGVGKAMPSTEIWSSVTLYIAPTQTEKDTDTSPGLNSDGSPSTAFTELSSTVLTTLTPKLLIGTTLTIQPPIYVDVITTISYTKLPQYTDVEIQKAIVKKMITQFGYLNNNFHQTIYPQDIEYQLQQVSGVKNARLTALHRSGGSGVQILTGAANEIFRFLQGNINV
jgi:hypothetical protein